MGGLHGMSLLVLWAESQGPRPGPIRHHDDVDDAFLVYEEGRGLSVVIF